jgi:predicted P-loop ATPase
LIITETETIFTEATTTDQVISSRFTSTTSQKEYLMSNSEQKFGRCGARGRRFGFVRFSKVRDKEKMVRALNQVWFGTFKVYANIAAFKRSEEKREEGGVRVETSEKMIEKGK